MVSSGLVSKSSNLIIKYREVTKLLLIFKTRPDGLNPILAKHCC